MRNSLVNSARQRTITPLSKLRGTKQDGTKRINGTESNCRRILSFGVTFGSKNWRTKLPISKVNLAKPEQTCVGLKAILSPLAVTETQLDKSCRRSRVPLRPLCRISRTPRLLWFTRPQSLCQTIQSLSLRLNPTRRYPTISPDSRL